MTVFDELLQMLELIWLEVYYRASTFLRRLRLAAILGIVGLLLMIAGKFLVTGTSVGVGQTVVVTGWIVALCGLAIAAVGTSAVLTGTAALGITDPGLYVRLRTLTLRVLLGISVLGLFLFVLGVYASTYVFFLMLFLGVTLVLMLMVFPGTGVWGRRIEMGTKGFLFICILGICFFLSLKIWAPQRLEEVQLELSKVTGSGDLERKKTLTKLDEVVNKKLDERIKAYETDLETAITNGVTDFKAEWSIAPTRNFSIDSNITAARNEFHRYVDAQRLNNSETKSAQRIIYLNGGNNQGMLSNHRWFYEYSRLIGRFALYVGGLFFLLALVTGRMKQKLGRVSGFVFVLGIVLTFIL
jgi:hypothetical protein